MSGCVSGFFTYETTKSVVVKSWSVGIINRIVQLLIIIYFVGYVFVYEKVYQVKDTGIESSVMTKVKGNGVFNGEVMDVADYVLPQQGTSVFCIITRMFVTPNQKQGTCAETEAHFNCNTDEDCRKHVSSNMGNGRITGTCVISENRCEIQGWCPAENDTQAKKLKNPMKEVENFTIFVKNSIRFPLFNVRRGNILPSTPNLNCLYDPHENSYCPIFRVGDVLRYAGENFSIISQKGGEIGINVVWKCNLDRPVEDCKPKYLFTRLDSTFNDSNISKGFNFRFAKYYKDNGTESRTLYKAYAIRFYIIVSGNAGKFSIIPTLINVVAACTSVGLATVLCDIILLNFIKEAEQYKAKKFEEVSESFKASWSNSGSKKIRRENNSTDSGAYAIGHPAEPLNKY
ncbi:P2X purinoceptor 3a [Trichomycterus rosablanca]|uniref:P2X purinoceptor 3a n=1 Tax=Trichomycterus rosablanca TaxID=2290929 RepID=UPI002F35DD6B